MDYVLGRFCGIRDFRWGAASLALILAACGGAGNNESAGGNPLDCFPPEARQWIQRVAAAETPRPRQGGSTAPAHIYVDRSGSMVGYLRPQTEQERPFEELVLNLPAMLNRQHLTSRFRAFGVNIVDLEVDQAQQLTNRAFYSCRGLARANCPSNKSHLDEVFRRIAAERDQPALVISDLWMSNPADPNSALGALNEPLTRILGDGRSIAIYGIAAPFNGLIDDLPYSPRAIMFSGLHPLFLVAVGTDEQLAALDAALFDAPTPYIARSMADGRIQRTLFSLSPAITSGRSSEPFGATTTPAMERIAVMETPGSRVQQYRVDRGAALRVASNRAGQAPSWTGPRVEGFARGSVWQGEFETRTRVWQRRGTACEAGAWLDGPRLPDSLWSRRGDSYTFSLRPDVVAAELPQEGTYLITGELVRRTLVRQGPAVAWMNDWSFSAETPSQRIMPDGRTLFRTLYLSEFARLIEVALADAAARRPAPVQGFAVVVGLTD